MLFLRLPPPAPGQKGWKLDPAPDISDIKPSLKIHVVSGSEWYSPSCLTWNEKSQTLELNENQKSQNLLPVGFSDILFAGNLSIRFSDEFADKLNFWLKGLTLSPAILQLEKSAGTIRFLWLDQESHCLYRRQLSEAAWLTYTRDLDHALDEIDIAIKNRQPDLLSEAWGTSRLILEKVLRQAEIPVTTLAPWRRLEIYTDPEISFLPLELLESEICVSHHLPRRPLASASQNNQPVLFTAIYGSELAHTAKEAGRLADSLEDKWEVESYSDVHYPEYQSRLSDTRVLHFAGHGRTLSRRSQIKLDQTWYESLLYSGGMDLSVFHSCQTGRHGAGILNATLRQGASNIIATPYLLPDENRIDFTRFYQHLQLDAVKTSFHFFQLLDRKFRRFYRLFQPFNTEI